MITEYEINESTMAIVALEKGFSRVIEEDDEFIVNHGTMDIIDNSCKFFGSSYSGRFEGTKYLIGVNYKAPIIVEETREMIFFPTSSPRFPDCNWIALNKIAYVEKSETGSVINFKNGIRLDMEISCRSLENQILRSTLLEAKMRNKKKEAIK